MMRSSHAICAIALVFGLAACSNMDEEVADETAAVVDDGSAGAQPASDEPALPAMNSSAYFMEVVGDRVFFAFDKAELSAESQETLFTQAEWLTQNEGALITIEGIAMSGALVSTTSPWGSAGQKPSVPFLSVLA